MSDPNEILENELRALRPSDASPGLFGALHDALADPASAGSAAIVSQEDVAARVRRLRASLWLSWSVAAAAACFAVAVFLRANEPAVSASQEKPSVQSGDLRVVPVSSSNTLVAARDEGIVYLDGGQPARRVRLQYLDTVKLRAAGETASIDVSYPREEIRLVPVNAL